jgi:hypothetical protein
MASAASEAAVIAPRGRARAQARHADDAVTAAWLCAIPCAAIAVVAIILFGPPLGRLLTPAHTPDTFFSDARVGLRPEPTEHARYLLAICAPLLGVLATASAPRWLFRVPPPWIGPTVVGSQLALVGVIVGSIVTQYRLRIGFPYTPHGSFIEPYFVPATLAVGVLLAAATTGALRSERLRQRAVGMLSPESRRRRLTLLGVAAAASAIWMLHAVQSDVEIGNALPDVRYHLAFVLDETFAVLNGRTPLVDFTAQYASLWPYAIAVPMLAFGKTVLVFTIVLCTLTALTLLAIYGVLRRATNSAAAALVLYLPLLATSLYQTDGTLQSRASIGTYYGSLPLRYAMPFFLAWLTARRLHRRREDLKGAWLLFTVAGLALSNNGDYGTAAFGAVIAALLWSADSLDRRTLLRLGTAVVAGLATAGALVSLLTLARAGALPQPGRLMEYARTYAIDGFAMLPIPSVLGVHLLVYLTYVAAIVVATVRALRHATNRVLTGMLAWAGVFGLGAGTYYVGRSHPESLKHEFAAWALALALLTIVAVRELAAPTLRRTAIGAFVVLFGFGVAACSLAQTPTPWGQIERLQAAFVPTEAVPDREPLAPSRNPATRRFVASLADGRDHFVVKHGAPVVILLTTGHRAADAYGVVNVSPYTGIESMYTVERMEAALDALRDAGGNTVIVPDPVYLSLFDLLLRRHFEPVTAKGVRPLGTSSLPLEMTWHGDLAVMKWVDTRHLHPRALR